MAGHELRWPGMSVTGQGISAGHIVYNQIPKTLSQVVSQQKITRWTEEDIKDVLQVSLQNVISPLTPANLCSEITKNGEGASQSFFEHVEPSKNSGRSPTPLPSLPSPTVKPASPLNCNENILVFTCIVTVNAFYSSTDVIKLTSLNFNSQVILCDKLWLVEFYVHWCEHCEKFVPEWIQVASALKGIVKVGAIDVAKYASIGHQYEIEEFPTIKFFGVNKNKPEKYYGGRSSVAITNGVLNSIRFIVRERLVEKSNICGSEEQRGRITNKNAFELTDSNFDNQVAGDGEIWIVEFYAPWCEHCLSQEPEWINAVVELARRTKGKIHLAAVDSTINVMLATRFEIQQVPMIKIFQTNKEVIDYNGDISAPSIIATGLELYSKMPLYKPFEQMVSEEILKSVCGHQVLCIIAVVPHISDTGTSGRSDYLNLLIKIAHKYKKKKWGWLWTETGAQPKLECALGIRGLAYPNIISIDARRKKYMLLKGSFSECIITEFFRKLSMGHVARIPLSVNFPKVKTVKRWDSKEEFLKEDPIILSGPTIQELENEEL